MVIHLNKETKKRFGKFAFYSIFVFLLAIGSRSIFGNRWVYIFGANVCYVPNFYDRFSQKKTLLFLIFWFHKISKFRSHIEYIFNCHLT